MNPLVQLATLGQSPWFDYIQRGMILSGTLQAMIDRDGLMGITSNPSIFEKSIGGSADYSQALKQLAVRPIDVQQIYETLAIRDIQDAADTFYPVYTRTEGRDGYVSLEVSPYLADRTEETIEEALRLHHAVGRDNVMIKIPATPQGIPAIEALIGRGININVTLLFSVEIYAQVAWAYISGLEKWAASGQNIRPVASVASFFISRIDTWIDNWLSSPAEQVSPPIATDGEDQARHALKGKAAIANAKMAYVKFQEIFSHPRFLALQSQGARVQRLLWGSTGTKNPQYPDTYYVDALIAPDTVNTLPVATFNAFRDHGHATSSLLTGLDEAKETLRLLAKHGLSMQRVTDALLRDGVRLFSDALTQLLRVISEKRQTLLGPRLNRQTSVPEDAALRSRLEAFQRDRFVPRLWETDASLWPHKPTDRMGLGWLHAPDWTAEQYKRVQTLVASIHAEGFTHILLMGMGGSSLCPQVLREMFGVVPGYPVLHVLDSTIPSEIRRIEAAIEPAKTLYVLSSKSGTTLEVMMFYQYFRERMRQVKGDRTGNHFVAITDPGSPLEHLAREQHFREILPGTPDIGGRYAALSYFGMVPAALMGIDIACLLERALLLRTACAPSVPLDQNPGVTLGALMGEMARRGRNKLTWIASPSVRPLGLWLEQLIAESTGKNGTGIIPIHDEPVGPPTVYAQDRLFVYLRATASPDEAQDQQVNALEKTGHPIVRVELSEPINVGQEFFRWEMATAVAGSILEINPFDQPHVEESKRHTRNILAGERPVLQGDPPLYAEHGIRIDADEENRLALRAPKDLREALTAHLDRLGTGDYVALLAYLAWTAAHHTLLQSIRRAIRDQKQVATTLGYGPRFLHSTGQLHKGGPPSGLFIQITADEPNDLQIPGETYSFGMLASAQALGDAIALGQCHRRLIRIHLDGDIQAALCRLLQVLEKP